MPRFAMIKTLLLSAAFNSLSLPSFAAELSYACSYFQPPAAGATRIPRSTGAAHFNTTPAFTCCGISGSPATVPLSTLTCATSVNGIDYTLQSAAISGGLQGVAHAFFPPFAPSPPPSGEKVWVGQSNIVVTYIYIPAVGGTCRGCPPEGEAVIDEMNDSDGLLDDEFVQVFAPPTMPSAPLTNTGNFKGTVETTDNAVKIEADVNPTDASTGKQTSSVFDRWGAPNIEPGDRALNLAKLQSGYFLAYYHSPCPSNFHYVSSAKLSECVSNNCKAGEVWNSTENQCVTQCGAGAKCGNLTCPKACGPQGCIIGPAKPGMPPEIACKKDVH